MFCSFSVFSRLSLSLFDPSFFYLKLRHLSYRPRTSSSTSPCLHADASAVSVIDAIADVVGLPNVVQHLGGVKFQCTVYTSAAMEQLLRHGGLSICGKTVAIEALAPRLTRVACLSLPGYVADEHLLRAMAPFGKVFAVERPATVDRIQSGMASESFKSR